ncbi:uncharacterized protein F5147DRAFT_741806 [Suillus discolor]|uniref:Uncharacterized protein n=1 Tax=Suillus discolor TaxID=1912936 RepID=A0A9P7FK81_9AGAM|nr:uncharacterized protein F5147DRAFT_741806 [Suillus discolor]KAG2120929.1 hypothetical protein F5147DRAFT_741806 [Suillus discolor]
MTTTTATASGSTPPGPLILPYPGTKHAPPKFKGEFTQVKKFIKQYEKLYLCENVIQYCSTYVTDLIEVLESFFNYNWTQLKADLMNNFDADHDTKRYKPKDLNKKQIRTLSEWKCYMRKFTIIGGWLKTHHKISSNDHATYLWKVEGRLIARDPLCDCTIPYSPTEIVAAVTTNGRVRLG